MRSTLLLIAAILVTSTLHTQTPLPYASGFDNAAQQAGWQLFRKGYLSNYPWTIAPFFAASAPNKLWHDYNVAGEATDTIRDWYVSPGFDLSGGGALSLNVNVFSIMGSTTPSDGLKVMLLTGNSDPALAKSVVEVEDLTGLVTNTDAWTSVGPLAIPATVGTSYIAFMYQATTNWFTPGVDDISITGSGTGMAEPVGAPLGTTVFPVPATGRVTITLSDPASTSGPALITVLNDVGQVVLERSFSRSMELNGILVAGMYAYRITDRMSGRVGVGRFVIQ